jgi:hypothetical protein
MSPLGTAALALAEKGLRVFPCIERGKKPAVHDNLDRATTDPNVIAGWWRWTNYNIGIATGPGSGIWVLDIDSDEGEALLHELEAKHGALPPTIEVITGDGRHLYWRWPSGCEIRNKQDNPVMPGIDVRGEGGYVLAPCSVHPSGRVYSWSVDNADEFADAPEWLIDLVQRKRRGDAEAPPTLPAAWRTFIGDTYEGSHRAHAIARLAGLLLRRYIDPLVALDLVRLFNAAHCQPPLDDKDVVRIVTDITTREKQRREGTP